MDGDTDGDTDEALMLAYAAGDAGAFDQLFARYRRPVFTYLLHLGGSRALAEDLFQEVFLRLIRARERYRPEGTLRSWLFTIARNALTDQRRRAALRETERTEDEMKDMTDGTARAADGLRAVPSSDGADPAAHAHARELRERSVAALLKLPPEQREVFLLRQRAGLDFRRIAEITGCELATAKSRMRYALAGLRRMLANELAVLAEGSHE